MEQWLGRRITFDKSMTQPQRVAVGEILKRLYPSPGTT
jgi:hypothetical protein